MRRESRRLLVLLAVVGILAVGYLVAFKLLMDVSRQRAASPISPVSRASISGSPSTSTPLCPSARLPDAAGLGDVAWIDSGSLLVMDVGSCKQSTLVSSDAAPPVRFSNDGMWLAFGPGKVIPASGGAVNSPFGNPVSTWAWSPTSDVLAAVTKKGGVQIAGPELEPKTLLPDGSGVEHLAFSPDGRDLAIDRQGLGIQVLNASSGRPKTAFPESDPSLVPEVASWSGDGRWILYWRGPVSAKGGPLDAVPASGGPWVNVFDPVLPYRDFLSSCGSQVALSAGPGLGVTEGKQIILNGPPDWSYHYASNDFSRSWFWPACSPDARWIAATDSFNQTESVNNTIPRALWLFASDGSSRTLLVSGTNGAMEYPRWSSDGAVIMVVVRSGHRWSSPGSLLLVHINPKSGKLIKVLGPIADLGSAPGPGGHQAWSEISDWYRP
jgi:hypothetical protein